MADNEIDIRIDNKQVLSALEQINKRLEDFGKTSQKNISRFENAAKDSFSSVSKSLKDLKSPLDTISGVMQGLGVVALGALGVKAFKAVASQFDTVVDAAVRQENALNQLRFAMARTGEFTNEAFKDMQQFASALQDTTGVGDEATLEMLSLAKSFGASNKQAKLLTEAAIELSAATGKSTNEAIRQVSKTLGGFAGELGEVNPKIKALTAEQLKAGEAARILLDQYGGSAANKMQTFSGALEAAKGRFSDLLEVIGDLIIKNPVIIDLIKNSGDAFRSFAEVVKGNEVNIKGFVNELAIGFLKVIPPLLEGLSLIEIAFKGFGEGFNIKSFFDGLADSISFLVDELLLLARGFTELKLLFSAPIDVISADSLDELRKSRPDLAAFINQLEEIDKRRDAIASGAGMRTQGVALAEGASAPAAVPDSFSGQIAAKIDSLIKSLEVSSQETGNNTAEVKNQIQATKDVSKAFQAPDKLFDFGAVGDALLKGANAIKAAGETFVKGLLPAVVGGAEGARKLLVEGGAKAVDAFAPGAGEAAKPIIEALSQGPDFVRQQVREFVAALPMLIDNIAQAIPVLIEELAKNTDEIIIALVKGTPQIIRALVIEVPKQLTNPALWFDVAKSLGEALASEIVGGQVSFSAEKLNSILADIWKNFAGGIGFSLEKLNLRFKAIEFTSIRIGNIFSNISKDFGNQVSNTLKAIPQGIKLAFAQSLPQFAIDLGNVIEDQAIIFRDQIVFGITQASQIIQQTFTGLAEIYVNIGMQLFSDLSAGAAVVKTELAQGLSILGDQDKLNKAGRNLAKGITERLSELTATPRNLGIRLFNGFFDAFLDKANAMGQAIADGFSIDTGGGGEGLVPDSTPIIGGLAKGGTIPPGFNNDTFSAFLSSGELVVPRDDVDRLRGFLDQQETGTGNADNGLIAALLAQILTALNQPMTVTTQANINGKAFADIILKLNRNNARLTA